MGADGTDNAQTVTDLHLDCYAILGVRPDAEEFVIREAFETLTQQSDPEHFPGSEDEAHRKLSDLASAYAILSDPVRRRRYDLRRRIDALIAPLTANDAPRPKGSPPAVVVDHSKVTLGPRRNQVLLPAVLGALIVVAVATVYQYSGRPETERQRSSLPAPPVAAEAKPAAITQPMTQPSVPRAEIPAQPSDAGANAAVKILPPTAAAPTLQQETMSPPPKPSVAKNPPINRAGDASSPAAVASESCSDVATVLGLCKRKSTAKEK